MNVFSKHSFVEGILFPLWYTFVLCINLRSVASSVYVYVVLVKYIYKLSNYYTLLVVIILHACYK